MSENSEKLPLDARLLSESIHELNIARRNVSIYPEEHPIVEKSLSKAYDCFVKLFELREEITLSVAKDTLIIDDYYLDKSHPVFKEFALCLTSMNMAHITFQTGLSRAEVYNLLRYIMDNAKESSPESLKEALHKYDLIHVRIEFIDYGAFTFDEGITDQETSDDLIWERYIAGLKEGRLRTEEMPSHIKELSPEKLASLLNRSETEGMKEESYDRVISAYMRRSSERAFSGRDLKKIMDFINGLRPELKKQFLSSALKNVSSDIDDAESALRGISAEEVLTILRTINEQKVAIPEALKNLLDKFSKLNQDNFRVITVDGAHMADDILLSHDVMNLLSDGDFEKFVSREYQKEIEKLLNYDAPKSADERVKECKEEFSDEFLETAFNETLLLLLSSDLPDFIHQNDHDSYISLLKQQIEQFFDTGQYRQVLKTVNTISANIDGNRLAEINSKAFNYFHSPECINHLINSFTVMGRLMRDDAFRLVDYYGTAILPPLMDALVEEPSPTTRRFLISLITHFGSGAVPEAVKRLSDSRWYVQRNMLLILEECGSNNLSAKIRPFCVNENPKVSLQAIKNLLRSGDTYAVEALRKHLNAKNRDVVNRAAFLAGAYKIKEMVPDLIRLLRKTALSGGDYQDKIPVVRALGMIGDTRALDALSELLESKSIFFKSAIDVLKKEIQGTLKNYPQELVRDIMS